MNKDKQTSQVIKLTINGYEKEIYVKNSETLLYTLREKLGLTSVKPGCANGDCGSCTILINGTPINSCHILSVESVNQLITTIEGLADTTIQKAFIKHWAIQCGYCTPGFILNVYALSKKYPYATDDQINEWLDSNICRCTGYMEIKEAVHDVLKVNRSYGKHA